MSRSCSVAVVEEKTLFFEKKLSSATRVFFYSLVPKTQKRRVFPQGLCTGYRSCVSSAAVECATVDYAAVENVRPWESTTVEHAALGTYDRRKVRP